MRMVHVSLCAVLLAPGCSAAALYPITDGFHKALPQRNTRVVVWSDHPNVLGTATTWLQKRELTIVELAHTPDDEAQVLRVGKLLGAETVIFVDTSFQKELASSYYVGAYGGGGGTATVYSVNVSIRGVNVETSEVAWSGTARYPDPIGGIEDALTKLTCQALATAWGFRPAGQQEIASQAMCSVGANDGFEKR
jgi:hypothetical protein